MNFTSPSIAPAGMPPDHSVTDRIKQMHKHHAHFLQHGMKEHCITREWAVATLKSWGNYDPKLMSGFPTADELRSL